MSFRKSPTPLNFGKLYCNIILQISCSKSPFFRSKICNIVFGLKVPPLLELFRKFNFLVPSTRPLPSWATYTPVWFFVKLISLYYLIFQRPRILRNGEGSCCHVQAKRYGCCVCVSGGSDIISQFQTLSWFWLRKIN